MSDTIKTGKRELLARWLHRTGLVWLASRLHATHSLLVLTYHRIGDPSATPFDPGVYSATADEFHDQMAYLRKTADIVTVDEALACLDGAPTAGRPRCRALVTFDDGCIDNYEVAFPILRSLGIQGLFFLISGMAGTGAIPWWDRIAYILRTATRSAFPLTYPAGLAVDTQSHGFHTSLRLILQLYKRPDNADGERFIAELRAACGGQEPPASSRIFLDWDEARAMIAGGMAIGSHTHSHPVLSQLSDEQQLQELVGSRRILAEQLRAPIDTIAYPVGARSAFTPKTQELARQAGYRAAFSYYGGINLPGRTPRFDVARQNVGGQSPNRFAMQVQVAQLSGRFWP